MFRCRDKWLARGRLARCRVLTRSKRPSMSAAQNRLFIRRTPSSWAVRFSKPIYVI